MTTAIAIKMSDTEVARLESILENTGKLVEIGLATAAELEAATVNLRHARIINAAGNAGMTQHELGKSLCGTARPRKSIGGKREEP